ncbi:type II toxin-antitoxin system HicA family toxin [Candidatus Parcubacteria bacterium]|nr:type II toxin-antitoxin system HicA family toxin [Candidatus Parcubacteria bacterium]
MPKLPVIRARELIRALKKLGFFEYHQVGSHAQFKHEDGRRITIPVHQGKDINRGTLRGIISDLNISVDEFIKVLKNK